MKYQSQLYAKALTDILEKASKKEEGRILKNFVGLIFKNGDVIFAEKILSAVKKEIVKKKEGKIVEVSLARDLSEKLKKELTRNFSAKDDVRFSHDPSLIAGARITINGSEELNNSFQFRLNQMFKN